MKCTQCDSHRFHTKNKAKGIFACRACGALHKDGQFVGMPEAKEPVAPVTVIEDEADRKAAKAVEYVLDKPADVVEPEVVKPAKEEPVGGFLAAVKRVVAAMFQV